MLLGCEQDGVRSEADAGSQSRRLAALQEWLVERMGRGPPRIAHLPDHLLFSFLPAAFTLFIQPGSDPATDLTPQQCQVWMSARSHHAWIMQLIFMVPARLLNSDGAAARCS